MHARFTLGVIAALFLASFAWAASSLNLSRSNAYRVTCSSDLASPAQVKALLAELDKMGPADEAKLKKWLAANLRRLGIADDRIKKLIVLPPSKEMRETGIILLTNTADEAAAIAATVKSSGAAGTSGEVPANTTFQRTAGLRSPGAAELQGRSADKLTGWCRSLEISARSKT